MEWSKQQRLLIVFLIVLTFILIKLFRKKYFVNDYMLRLKCSHYHCKDCLLNDIKKKKCIKCERPLAGSEINFILDFITSKCKICGIRKKQDEFTVKNCCLKDICTKCQERNLTVCLGCHQRIDT